MENQVPEPSADRAEVLNLGAVLVLLCYKKTIWCRIVLWDHASPRQAHRRSASRHTWMAWRMPRRMLTGTRP